MKLALKRMLLQGGASAVAPHWFRVEHQDCLGRHTIGRVPNVFATHHALTPFLAHLLLDGATGEVVLIDELSGAEVARRFLNAPERSGRPLSASSRP